MIQIITPPAWLPEETLYWQQLLDEGADSILLRKPGWSAADYEQLLLAADASCYSKLMIAGHPALCEKYGLQGIHFSENAGSLLTAADIATYRQQGWLLSTSVHTTAALQTADVHWGQQLLAPIFDSISKPGHNSLFREDFKLSKGAYQGKVLALGGIDHNTAIKARNMQFDGIALLGAIWQQPATAISRFRHIRKLWHNTAHLS
ncbi:thiamine phosphate synthase [Chitinophaga pinensis]|uniref:Thiamine monophosphate synthase n=1 Tax=Chitinophaga pinensis (strain ATCC 43595 / DSM 2588 / LMG 13176 / NBRC 15968 / NCIMB 11800 / UQM 2034) TaxID=485918 RepID=A0A979FZN9_CHIPD|nr:thiamine phosphate synthase [Chitinophaga pinensis]ACU58120.1 thiamine monophosphate synthase [Chitinophaga pinensis DSM 2588]